MRAGGGGGGGKAPTPAMTGRVPPACNDRGVPNGTGNASGGVAAFAASAPLLLPGDVALRRLASVLSTMRRTRPAGAPAIGTTELPEDDVIDTSAESPVASAVNMNSETSDPEAIAPNTISAHGRAYG